MSDKNLFKGIRLNFGGLSNASDLAKDCPDEFKKTRNPWTDYASWFKFQEATPLSELTNNWKWRSDDRIEHGHKITCLLCLFHTPKSVIGPTEMNAVAGWMLSEMLKEVPSRSKKERVIQKHASSLVSRANSHLTIASK